MTDPTSTSTGTAVGAAAQAAAAIARAVDAAAEQIAILSADVAARDGQIEQLQEICDDRQRVIVEVGEHAQTYRRAAEERAGLVAALDFEVGRLRADLARLELERDQAVSAAAAAVLALDEERDRTRMVRAQNAADLRAAQRDAESVRARAGVLEEALAARSRLIDELQSACEERLALVDGLGAEVTSLRAVAEERLLLIEANESRYRAREAQLAAAGETRADGVDWRAIAEERASALQDVTVEAERRAVLLAELTSALEGKTHEIDDLRKRLTPTS
jgi:chromosome segregation ATPase